MSATPLCHCVQGTWMQAVLRPCLLFLSKSSGPPPHSPALVSLVGLHVAASRGQHWAGLCTHSLPLQTFQRAEGRENSPEGHFRVPGSTVDTQHLCGLLLGGQQGHVGPDPEGLRAEGWRVCGLGGVPPHPGRPTCGLPFPLTVSAPLPAALTGPHGQRRRPFTNVPRGPRASERGDQGPLPVFVNKVLLAHGHARCSVRRVAALVLQGQR